MESSYVGGLSHHRRGNLSLEIYWQLLRLLSLGPLQERKCNPFCRFDEDARHKGTGAYVVQRFLSSVLELSGQCCVVLRDVSIRILASVTETAKPFCIK